MDKKSIVDFFDSLAPSWDSYSERREKAIRFILSHGGVIKGARVLDVGCGTGILFADYIKIGAEVTGIDISPKMTELARKKYDSVNIICGDAETYDFREKFDVIMIHNAFPHFPDPELLLKHLSGYLDKEGRLSVAHSISEKELSECHSGSAEKVSLPLPSKEKLSKMMSEFLDVDIVISDEEKYFVSGIKKKI